MTKYSLCIIFNLIQSIITKEDNMKKKLIGLVLSLTMVGGLLAGCGSSAPSSAPAEEAATEAEAEAETEAEAADASAIKVGVIYVGDENEGYTESHMKGIQEMKTALGLTDDQIIQLVRAK